MKKILAVLAMALLFAVPCYAGPFAVCDPPATIPVTHYDLEVDGVVTDADIPAQPDGSVYFDCAAYRDSGQHTFRLRAKNEWGVSNWTDPLTGGSPPSPLGFGFSSE